ncbi:MAG: NAD(+)/NADH kinase [Candidatus Omnitrophica bacterium]|nr:NAD(+)/NADH kinase [Candidatus Omnitrophota bacterium]
MTIRNIFILDNKKIKGLDKEKERIERLLKRCGKDVQKTPEKADLIITMGGDGTFLKGVHLIKDSRTLIYGIKYGNVGFLANSAEDVDSKLKKVVKGDFKAYRRMLLDVTVKKRDGGGAVKDFCLNEVVFFRKGIRIINVSVSSKKEPVFSDIRTDGLIVSTPVGSTAHSLAASGPVISPCMECMLVVPVNPHSISWRPAILPSDEKIEVRVSPGASLAADGQREFELGEGDVVTVKKSARTVRMIMEDGSFFGKLTSKFNWGK